MNADFTIRVERSDFMIRRSVPSLNLFVAAALLLSLGSVTAAVPPPATLVASGLPPTGCTLNGETITCPVQGGIGDPEVNYFYVIRSFRKDGSWIDSNRTGEFDFGLTPRG